MYIWDNLCDLVRPQLCGLFLPQGPICSPIHVLFAYRPKLRTFKDNNSPHHWSSVIQPCLDWFAGIFSGLLLIPWPTWFCVPWFSGNKRSAFCFSALPPSGIEFLIHCSHAIYISKYLEHFVHFCCLLFLHSQCNLAILVPLPLIILIQTDKGFRESPVCFYNIVFAFSSPPLCVFCIVFSSWCIFPHFHVFICPCFTVCIWVWTWTLSHDGQKSLF